MLFPETSDNIPEARILLFYIWMIFLESLACRGSKKKHHALFRSLAAQLYLLTSQERLAGGKILRWVSDLCIFSPQNERARYTIPEFLLPHESSIPVVRQEDSDIEDEYEDDTTQGKRQRYGRGGRGIWGVLFSNSSPHKFQGEWVQGAAQRFLGSLLWMTCTHSPAVLSPNLKLETGLYNFLDSK